MYGKSSYVAPFEGGLGHASPYIPLLVSGSVYNQAVGGNIGLVIQCPTGRTVLCLVNACGLTL
jgi:hypothetical protein